jgi:hypothetical protein
MMMTSALDRAVAVGLAFWTTGSLTGSQENLTRWRRSRVGWD